VSFYFRNDSTDGWKYLKYHDIIFLVDGERWRFDTDHDGDIKDGHVIENLFVNLSEKRFLEVVNAVKVEIKVGADSFPIGPSVMEAIQDFASLIANPDAPIPDRFAEAQAALRKPQPSATKPSASRPRTNSGYMDYSGYKPGLSLSIAKNHEKDGRNSQAITLYKEIIKRAPGTGQANEAAERLKKLEAKK